MNGPDIIEDPEAYVAAMVDGFVTCALWADLDYGDTDEGGDYGAREGESADDLAPEATAHVVEVCARFCLANRDDLALLPELNAADRVRGEYGDAELAGHDLYLTSRGHGAGFWDRDYGDVGDRLTAACRAVSENNPYVGDDGLIYF